MRRTGVGLKPLIAIYLVALLSVCGLLLGLAAARLARHALLGERIEAGGGLLREFGTRIGQVCPELDAERRCRELSDFARQRAGAHPDLRALSLLDATGRVVASSDPVQGVRGMWDALGHLGSAGPSGRGWQVVETAEERLVLVEVDLARAGWQLRGAFGLAGLDATASRLTTRVLIYGILVVLALVVIGWLLLHRLVVRPVDRLLDVAGRFSEQGDWTWLIEAGRGTEFGRLGLSLGRMGRRIEEDQQRLKRQIAELEQLNRDLGQAQQAMLRQEKLASVGLLAAGLAHEVGNPMSAIVGYVGMLRTEQFPDEERADILARVERELERIDRIIKDLLAYSRPGRGLRRACAPAELVAEATGLLRPQQRFRQIHFAAEAAAGLPAVACDPDLVCQVLVNLTLNALDALPDGGHMWVRAAELEHTSDGRLVWSGTDSEPAFFGLGELHQLRPPRDGQGLPVGQRAVVFSVVDDGAGVLPADLARIFDPFFTTKQPGHGTGLGLAICHASVQSMGGEIWAFSRPGAGTQFAFWLPVADDG